MTPILDIQNLSIAFPSKIEENEVVHQISFQLHKNEILGIVGESGSGKSVTSLALLGLLPIKTTKLSGTCMFEGLDLIGLKSKAFRQIRGQKISMIFQEPMSSLNPSLTCGYQVLEILLEHTNLSKSKAKKEVIALFNQVKLPRAEQIYYQYPHQISGGQKQRVMIAMAIACKPNILIADEPTTALDVTVQKEIILLLKELQQETAMSIIFITHDLALISEIANRVLVMYQGNIVEQGLVEEVFKHSKHNYTKALIYSKPSLDVRLKVLPTISDFLSDLDDDNTKKNNLSDIISSQERKKHHEVLYNSAPLLEVKGLATYFGVKKNIVKAVDEVSLKIFEGETLGLVGESGCGKTTLGRTIMGLETATKGAIFYQGHDITNLKTTERRNLRKEIQIIFQDPFSSLNPRMLVGEAILEPMKVHNLFNSNEERQQKVFEILDKVGLERSHYYRYPHEFSGGQRQRIGIARTIALQPKLIICDESVSALDVSVQAQVLNLLNQLKHDFGFTYIFISHDLAVVKYMADQLVVMNQGKIEEIGDADAIYANPKTSYTKALIDAIPKGI
jgi:peptide/nickel transport system ATP-binding protein